MTTPDRAITQRPTSTSLLTIDSEDRFASYVDKRASFLTPYALNESPYNFRITKEQALLNGFMTRLAVTEVVFPWVTPNINPKTNTINFSYQIGAGPVNYGVVTLKPGFYKPADIAADIEDAVNAVAGAGFLTMTYGFNAMPIFTYNTDSSQNLIAFSPMPYNSITYPYPVQTKQLFDILGFYTTVGATLGNDTLQSGWAYNNTTAAWEIITVTGLYTFCQAMRYVDIVSPQLVANQGLPDATSQTIGRDALCRIYIGDAGQTLADASDPEFCPPGCRPVTIYRQFSTPKYVQWNAQMPVGSSVQFQVYDDTGVLLEQTGPFIGGGVYSDWSMTLLATEN